MTRNRKLRKQLIHAVARKPCDVTTGTLTLNSERQSARMSKITNDG